jgi:hypothetical protein
MRVLSGSTLDLATFHVLSRDQNAELRRSVSVHRGRHQLIVVLYLISAPFATAAWLAGLAWAAIKVVGYALS